MRKQCPECGTVTRDDVAYCPACACEFAPDPGFMDNVRGWQHAAGAIAAATLAATMLYFWVTTR